MNDKIFSELRVRYQIPEHIPIHLPYENKKCYTGRTVDAGMYDAMFATGLRLPLTALHYQLVNYLGLSVSQIAPNALRTFIGAEILWGSLSGGIRQLTLDEFFYCYRPHHISSSKGTYHFAVKEKDLKLVLLCWRDELGVSWGRVGDDASWLFWQYMGLRQRIKLKTSTTPLLVLFWRF